MHCKSGADRAGLMSVLYRHLHEGVPIEAAKKELSFKYGHIRQAHTGILDYFFERYIADNAARPMPFFDWVDTVYDPDELRSTFRSQGLGRPHRRQRPAPRVAAPDHCSRVLPEKWEPVFR